MATKTFTKTENSLICAIHDIVEEFGSDHIYDRGEAQGVNPDASSSACAYLNHRDDPTQGSCLIGRAILRIDLAKPESLLSHEGTSAGAVLGALSTDISGPVNRAMDKAQQVQDAGGTWGYAYAMLLLVLAEAGYPTSNLHL